MNIQKCGRCRKPLYPTDLRNNIRNTWCNCEKIEVPDGWSGYIQQGKDMRNRR